MRPQRPNSETTHLEEQLHQLRQELQINHDRSQEVRNEKIVLEKRLQLYNSEKSLLEEKLAQAIHELDVSRSQFHDLTNEKT